MPAVYEIPAASRPGARLWELDALRGAAVVAMVFYHGMWDLSFAGVYRGSLDAIGWVLFARSIALTFVVLVGVSMTLRQARTPRGVPARGWLERGVKVLAWGMVLSLVTWPIFGSAFIAYGVLHFIGTALLLAPLILRYRRYALPAAAVLFALDPLMDRYHPDTLWFLPLGLYPTTYRTIDYFPLVPWLGFVLLGVWAGPKYLAARERLASWPDQAPRWLNPLVFLGRHALL
ncbi:MAG TPA: heparan-alpha-glucosaminide N-acetyltransferase, partial [Limnochordales bacterium]